MFWLVLVVRVLVGLPFFVFGLNHFLNFMTMSAPPDLPENAKTFAGVLVATKYMDVVKVLEVVSGALILSGRLVPLGLVIATPVVVNIMLWDVLLMKQPGLGVVLTVLCVFLIWAYRSHFAPLFAVKPTIG
jgi:putative oxidoreductase